MFITHKGAGGDHVTYSKRWNVHTTRCYIVYSSLMEALNKGGKHERVLELMELMKQKTDSIEPKCVF
jgi:pentatricopeptide repeat protein